MPDKITLDDALGATSEQPRITFDEALAERQAASRPGGQMDVGRGESLIPGSWDTSGAFIPPRVAPRIEPATDMNVGAALKSGLVVDEDTKVRVVAESLGLPRDRVGLVDGKPVFVNDDGKLQYVSGLATRAASGVVTNIPEIAMGTLGSFAASPVAGSTLGVVGARGIKRAVTGLVFDEPQTIAGNLTDLATEGAANLVGGGLAKGAVKLGDKGKIIDFTPADVKTAEQVRDFVKQKLGIDLDLAQASGNRKLLALRDYAARYPGKVAEIVQAADEVAAGQLDAATTRVLDAVAKAESGEIVGKKGGNVAQEVIRLAREKVYADVSPLYEAAYRAVPEVTDESILKMLKLPRFPAALAKAKEMVELETGQKLADDAPMSLRLLDQTKRALDDEIQSLRDGGNRQMAAALQKRRDEFVAALDAMPNQQWQLARKRYGELINENVKPMEDGIVGMLANIENRDAATAAAKLFSDQGITRNELQYAKHKIEQQDPEAWKGLVRQWMGDKWNKALRETQAGDVVNPAGKFRQAVFGTPEDRKKMEAILPANAWQDFEALMIAMEKLAATPLGATRVAGSNTYRDTQIGEMLGGRLSIFMQALRPRETALSAAEERAREQGIEAITEAIFDPAKRSQLKRVVKMQPSTKQAMLISSIVGAELTSEAAARELSDDRTPLAPSR